MSHPTDILNLSIAFAASKFCKSNRKKIGCVIAEQVPYLDAEGKDTGHTVNHIIAEGTAGTVAGSNLPMEDEFGVTCDHVVHAEINAIKKAKQIKSDLSKCAIYVTTMPCKNCCQRILDEGIKKVVFAYQYKFDTIGMMEDIETVVVSDIELQGVMDTKHLRRIHDRSGSLRDLGYTEDQINFLCRKENVDASYISLNVDYCGQPIPDELMFPNGERFNEEPKELLRSVLINIFDTQDVAFFSEQELRIAPVTHESFDEDFKLRRNAFAYKSKSPIGIQPEWIYNHIRKNELALAITRRLISNDPIAKDWVRELRSISFEEKKS